MRPAPFEYMRLAHPPVTFIQETDKFRRRLPAAQDFIIKHGLNEVLGPQSSDVGIIVQGGLFNALNSRLEAAGLSNIYGEPSLPVLVLNVTHPLAPKQIEESAQASRPCLLSRKASLIFSNRRLGRFSARLISTHAYTARTCCRWAANTRSASSAKVLRRSCAQTGAHPGRLMNGFFG